MNVQVEWRIVPSVPYIEVSNKGHVKMRSIIHMSGGAVVSMDKPRLLSSHINTSNGFREVYVKDGETYYIHRLMAEAFLPNPDNLRFVGFKDNNPMNLDVDNLKWCNYTANCVMPAYGGKRVRCMETGQEWSSITEFVETNPDKISRYKLLQSIELGEGLHGKHYEILGTHGWSCKYD